MRYEAELRFLRETFEKYHLQTLLLNPLEPLEKWADKGLKELLGEDAVHTHTFSDLIPQIQHNTIYKMTNSYLCCYLAILLPDWESETVLLIGPYLPSEMSGQQILELAERFGISPRLTQQVKKYYEGIPVLLEDNPLFVMLDVFGEHIWGGSDNFSLVNINQETVDSAMPLFAEKAIVSPEQTVWNMQAMERRYAYENELIQAVSQGQLHKAERILSTFSAMGLDQRVADPIRNMKNYCIIMNTLLRKAAENGGVHPVYLDSVSCGFAKKIESINSAMNINGLMAEMIRTYCRLVKKHCLQKYSSPVQKAITYIDADLTADLSLSALATMQNVSAGYLSALFKQETGQTLTEHVNQKRVKQAMQLLKTTKLQIQTIAQHCGVVDVHYFSKMFKKYVGMTPKEYRDKV